MNAPSSSGAGHAGGRRASHGAYHASGRQLSHGACHAGGKRFGPEDRLRRSPLYRVCAALGAHWMEVAGFACPAHYGDPEGEAEAARRLAIADLTALPCAGWKGWDVTGWAAAQGLVDLPPPNRARRREDGTLVCRLAEGEALLLAGDDGASATVDSLAAAWTMAGASCYPVPRADTNVRLAIAGAHAAEAMAKLCGVDLRRHRFADLDIAQTSVARINAIVVRADRKGVHALDMAIDSASAVYMWECLADAMTEFEGRVVGLEALRTLAA